MQRPEPRRYLDRAIMVLMLRKVENLTACRPPLALYGFPSAWHAAATPAREGGPKLRSYWGQTGRGRRNGDKTAKIWVDIHFLRRCKCCPASVPWACRGRGGMSASAVISGVDTGYTTRRG